jgi:protein ImuA
MATISSALESLRHVVGRVRREPEAVLMHCGLDDLSPRKGVPRGALVELFGGGTTLATVIARESLREEGAVVVVDATRRFYPPAAARLGLDLERLIVVQPREPDWFVTQALSCPGVDAVLCWPRDVSPTMFRRWQLAAERGGSVGLLVRSSEARAAPSWADVRLVVEPQGLGRWRLERVTGSGGDASRNNSLNLSIDDEGRLHDCERVVSELAGAATAMRAAGS